MLRVAGRTPEGEKLLGPGLVRGTRRAGQRDRRRPWSHVGSTQVGHGEQSQVLLPRGQREG